MKTALTALSFLLASTLCLSPAVAKDQSLEMSQASGLIVGGSALVVAGSLSAVAASGTVVIESVAVVGESVIIVLAGASEAARATVKLSAAAAAGASLVAGATVSVVLIASGTILVVAGEAIAFIPKEVAKSLIYPSRIDARGY